MHRVMGCKIVTNTLSVVVLGGTRSEPIYLKHQKISTPAIDEPAEYTTWSETQFGNLLTALRPDAVVYRLTTGLEKHEQIFRIYYGLGILNLVAHRMRIPISHISPQSMRPPSFGLPKDSDINSFLISVLGNHPPYWNGDVLEAAGAAFLRLPR